MIRNYSILIWRNIIIKCILFQNINLLKLPDDDKMIKNNFIKNFLLISRAKIQIGTFPHAALGLVLGSNSFLDLTGWSILIYIILYFLLITYACNINCYFDMDVDKLYKKDLYNASKSIGIKNIKFILLFEVILISLLIYFLFLLDYTITVVIALFGLLLATFYSIKFIRIKSRGLLSPFPVLIGLYMLPILGGWFLKNDFIPLFLIIFLLGYGFMNEGFTLVNTCEDYEEDEKVGIKTWAHIFGLKKTICLGLIFSSMGYLCILGISIRFFTLSDFNYLKIISYIIMFIISIFAISFTLSDLWRLNKQDDLKVGSKFFGKKMPKWFIMTRYPLLLLSLVLIF